MPPPDPPTVIRRDLLIALSAAMLPTALMAVTPPPSTESTAMPVDNETPPKEPRPPESTLEFRAQARRLATIYGAMAYSGDADHDFTALLRPLQVAMAGLAKTELAYGRDAGLKSIAGKLSDLASAMDRELATRKPR